MSIPDDSPRVVAGRYELHRLLGRGGAGEVWRGLDTRLGRPVAVKLVRIPSALDGRDQAETRHRVLREARAAARLDHPAAVTMYDVIEADDELCLVMELVDAPDLGRLVADSGPLPPAEAARIGLDVLDALQAAHARGLVHRDVKPSNVLVPSEGRARLTDFGTAVIAGEDRLTATGMVFGSPAYMAPEQAVDVEVGPAADLWALGATLYQAVEGVPPFSGPTPVATMYAVMHDDPRPMGQAGALQHVIDRLLIREPAARAEAPEVRELLGAVASASTAVLPAAPARHRSPAAGGDATGAMPSPSAADGAGDTDVGWGASPVSRGRRGPRSRTSAILVLGVAALLVGAVALAWIANRGGPTDSPAVIDAAAPTPSVEGAGAGSTPTAVATPTPAETAGEATASPSAQGDQEDADGDERDEDEEDEDEDEEDEREEDERSNGNQGQGNGDQGQGNGNQGNQGNQGEGNGGTAEEAEPAVGVLPAAPVPEEWVTYAPDEAPYVVAHPPQWTVDRLDATRTDIADPGSTAYLRLDWTDDPAPDPVADWEAYEPQFAAGREGYERLRMEPTTFKGEPAAMWEYRYARDGVTYHAYNLNVSGGGYGYALNFQTREEEWGDLSPLFSAFAESYRIPS